MADLRTEIRRSVGLTDDDSTGEIVWTGRGGSTLAHVPGASQKKAHTQRPAQQPPRTQPQPGGEYWYGPAANRETGEPSTLTAAIRRSVLLPSQDVYEQTPFGLQNRGPAQQQQKAQPTIARRPAPPQPPIQKAIAEAIQPVSDQLTAVAAASGLLQQQAAARRQQQDAAVQQQQRSQARAQPVITRSDLATRSVVPGGNPPKFTVGQASRISMGLGAGGGTYYQTPAIQRASLEYHESQNLEGAVNSYLSLPSHVRGEIANPLNQQNNALDPSYRR